MIRADGAMSRHGARSAAARVEVWSTGLDRASSAGLPWGQGTQLGIQCSGNATLAAGPAGWEEKRLGRRVPNRATAEATCHRAAAMAVGVAGQQQKCTWYLLDRAVMSTISGARNGLRGVDRPGMRGQH